MGQLAPLPRGSPSDDCVEAAAGIYLKERQSAVEALLRLLQARAGSPLFHHVILQRLALFATALFCYPPKHGSVDDSHSGGPCNQSRDTPRE
jgi:hypothetical protein